MRPQAVIAAVVALLGVGSLGFVLLRPSPIAVVDDRTGTAPATPTPTESERVDATSRRPAAPAGEARIDVRVIEPSGERVVGCVVELWHAPDAGASPASTEPLARATSTGGGAIRFAGLALGPYELRVADPAYDGEVVPITLDEAMGFGQAVVMVQRKP